MINIIDLLFAGFALLYLLRKAGGIIKTLKNLSVVFMVLLLVGVFARLVLDLSFAKPVHKTLRESYFVKLSQFLIKQIYPAVEKNAPKVDTFIKEKIISAPTPEVGNPAVLIFPKSLPRLPMPELPKLK